VFWYQFLEGLFILVISKRNDSIAGRLSQPTYNKKQENEMPDHIIISIIGIMDSKTLIKYKKSTWIASGSK